MKYSYHKALLEEGYDENSKMYKDVNKVFDCEAKKHARRLAAQEKCGIVFNLMSAFEGEDGSCFDCFASDEDVEETVLHEIEMQDFHECLLQLSYEDRVFLLRIFNGKRGTLAAMERELGISHNTLLYRKKKLMKILREKMKERNY